MSLKNTPKMINDVDGAWGDAVKVVTSLPNKPTTHTIHKKWIKWRKQWWNEEMLYVNIKYPNIF